MSRLLLLNMGREDHMITKKQARRVIEALLHEWNASKMDKELFLIEYNGRVQEGEFT